MSTMIQDNSKNFEKPGNGTYIGVVADVVDLGMVSTSFGQKPKIRIVWILDKKDAEGNPFRVMSQVTASANEKSALYGIVKGVLGAVPPPPFDAEILIGKSNQLFVVQEPNQDGTKVFANVKVILPLPAGTPAMLIPAGFVRDKDKTKQPGQQARPQQVAPAAPPAPASTVGEEDIPF